MSEIPDSQNFAVTAQIPGTFNTPEARMPEQVIPLGQLCNADKSARIKFALVSEPDNHIYNEAITSLNDLIDGSTTLQAGNGTTIFVDNLRVFQRPTLVDYLRSGWSISMVGAVDYTLSNGDPSKPSSNHYIGGNN